MADKKDDSDSESAKKPVNWGEFFSILMVHAGMTKEEIGNSSIPFIFAIMSTMGKRLCEKLGVPYKTKEEREEEKKQEEEDYPVPEASRRARKNRNTDKTSSDKKTYRADSKQDILDFFGGMATFEDS